GDPAALCEGWHASKVHATRDAPSVQVVKVTPYAGLAGGACIDNVLVGAELCQDLILLASTQSMDSTAGRELRYGDLIELLVLQPDLVSNPVPELPDTVVVYGVHDRDNGVADLLLDLVPELADAVLDVTERGL